MRHAVTWQTAEPLWTLSLADAGPVPERFRAPALLRFAGDDFMPQLRAALAASPPRLARFVARPESWRDERAGWQPAPEDAAADVLKLFQPVHYRFYIVSASLVCQLPGLPDRRVDLAAGECVSFVVRRLMARPGRAFSAHDPDSHDEYGWSGDQQAGRWLAVVERGAVAPFEERIPMFPAMFGGTAGGKPRTLQAGVVPAARRDVYEAGAGAAELEAPAALLRADTFADEPSARIAQQIEPGLAALAAPEGLAPPLASGADEENLRDQARLVFAHLLLDLALFVDEHAGPVHDALAGAQPPPALSSAQRALYDYLNRSMPGLSRTYREALAAVTRAEVRTKLEDGSFAAGELSAVLGRGVSRPELQALAQGLRARTASDTLQSRLLAALPDPRLVRWTRNVAGPLAELASVGADDDLAQDALMMVLLALGELLQQELPLLWIALKTGQSAGLTAQARAVYERLRSFELGGATLQELVVDADDHRREILAGHITPQVAVVRLGLGAAQIAGAASLAPSLTAELTAALAAEPLPTPAQAKARVAASPPAAQGAAFYVVRCVYERPACAALHEAVVSAPTAPFQLASFFDAEAPVRPLRIQMPDVSLAALRKSPKGVAFAMSKELREQVNRVRNAGMKKLMDRDLPAGPSFDFGLVCSLSIPIITICAFILLMIIVQLLNIVFWWIPYFILCLPRIGVRR